MRKDEKQMNENQCEYRDGCICNAFLDVCCVYQRIIRHDGERPLKNLRECYCNYPNVAVSKVYEDAIKGLAKGNIDLRIKR